MATGPATEPDASLMTTSEVTGPSSSSSTGLTTGPTTAIILKGYPRLSETFIAQEIRALERAGLAARIISLRHPTDRETHPIHDEIIASVSYLPEYLYQEPARVARAWRVARCLPGYAQAFQSWRRDLRRDPTPNRVRRFGQALVLATELPSSIKRLHAHFLHTPASVTRYASMMTGLPWSVSAHAVDIWTTPAWELSEKLDSCDWAVTCTKNNTNYLRDLCATPEKISLSYHGIDLGRFAAAEVQHTERDGRDFTDPVVILSVGRAVEKKGYEVLLSALAALPHELSWRLVHIGGGALQTRLQQQAQRLGIGDRIRWLGAQPHSRVLSHYRVADVFVLASRIASNGDRDGLPNVLMEAQSQGLPCVSTDVSAIPELIIDAETGLLSAPDDSAQLARNIQALITSPVRRRALGEAGSRRVRGEFDFQHCIASLLEKFELSPKIPDTPATKVA